MRGTELPYRPRALVAGGHDLVGTHEAARPVVPLHDQHALAGARQVGGAHERVVPAADHDHVICLQGFVSSRCWAVEPPLERASAVRRRRLRGVHADPGDVPAHYALRSRRVPPQGSRDGSKRRRRSGPAVHGRPDSTVAAPAERTNPAREGVRPRTETPDAGPLGRRMSGVPEPRVDGMDLAGAGGESSQRARPRWPGPTRLRAARRDQDHVRPAQPVPNQPQHPATPGQPSITATWSAFCTLMWSRTPIAIERIPLNCGIARPDARRQPG